MDAISLHCARCDYDLRTLDPAGLCPECALPIGQSILAFADPLARDRGRIGRATIMLQVAMAVRLWIALWVLGYHLVNRNEIVYASITSQLLDLWPVDGVVSSAIWIFRPGGMWILVRALLVLDFALFCAGVAVLTRQLRSAQGTWTRWLPRITLAAAAASVLYIAGVRAALDSNSRTVLNWLGSNALVYCAAILPPTALAAWTARLLFLATRNARSSHRRTRVVTVAGVVFTVLAAIYNSQWIYERGTLARWGAFANVATFATVWWMWRQLGRLARVRSPALPIQ
jgi:hypothetical protein